MVTNKFPLANLAQHPRPDFWIWAGAEDGGGEHLATGDLGALLCALSEAHKPLPGPEVIPPPPQAVLG